MGVGGVSDLVGTGAAGGRLSTLGFGDLGSAMAVEPADLDAPAAATFFGGDTEVFVRDETGAAAFAADGLFATGAFATGFASGF